MDDPLQSFKAESDRRLQDIKVTPELRQRTLARIQQSGRKSASDNRSPGQPPPVCS